VGDDDHGGTAMRGGTDEQVDDVGTGRRVEGAGGFVGEDGLRLADQGSRDRDALRLTTGQLTRSPTGLGGQADLREHHPGPTDGLAPVHTVDHQRQCDVLVGGQFGEQLVVLENEAEPATPQDRPAGVVQLIDPLAGQPDLALVRGEDAGQDMQERGLAVAARAHDRERFT
jgi:acyl-CoA thioesterase-1